MDIKYQINNKFFFKCLALHQRKSSINFSKIFDTLSSNSIKYIFSNTRLVSILKEEKYDRNEKLEHWFSRNVENKS